MYTIVIFRIFCKEYINGPIEHAKAKINENVVKAQLVNLCSCEKNGMLQNVTEIYKKTRVDFHGALCFR